MIVYPAIDIYGGRAVRMTRGDFATVEEVASSPLEAAKKLVAEGAEWLHIVDLDGSRTGTPGNLDAIRVIANRFTVKIQAGGGIRDFDTAEAFAEAGATRIVVGTAAIRDPELIDRLVDRHADGLAVSVDARNGMVTTAGWTQTTDLRAVDVMQRLAVKGVPTVIYTNVSIDGTLQGLDLVSTEAVARAFGAASSSAGRSTSDSSICARRCASRATERSNRPRARRRRGRRRSARRSGRPRSRALRDSFVLGSVAHRGRVDDVPVREGPSRGDDRAAQSDRSLMIRDVPADDLDPHRARKSTRRRLTSAGRSSMTQWLVFARYSIRSSPTRRLSIP